MWQRRCRPPTAPLRLHQGSRRRKTMASGLTMRGRLAEEGGSGNRPPAPEGARDRLPHGDFRRSVGRTSLRCRLAEAVSKLPSLSDTQIATHDLVSKSPNESPIGKTEQSQSTCNSLPQSSLGHDLARTDATLQNGLKTGGGGNRFCREVQSIGQNTISSPHRRSTLDI